MSRRRAVVTGLGMLSPLGNDVASNWESIRAGKSGIAPIIGFDTTDYGTRFGGELKNFSSEGIIERKDLRRLDAFSEYGLVAAVQGLEDAGISPFPAHPERYAVYIGSGIGGIDTIYRNSAALLTKGPRRVSPFFVSNGIINMVSGNLSIRYGFQGGNLGFATACTTGTHSIGLGMRAILYGEADVVVVGGAEAPVNPLGLAGFTASRSLSTRNDAPQEASRPWDKDRDGFVLSEGAGILILEEYEHARARDARIYAEVKGFGMSADAHHITAPPENGDGAAFSMKAALDDAQMAPQDIQYINAHGTSTTLGDLAEVRAIKNIFATHANKLSISSTKSMIGHLLGASGAVEAIYSILAIQSNLAPPTINLQEPDEDCDLDFVPQHSKEMKIDRVLSNSFGFGGTNASIIFSRL